MAHESVIIGVSRGATTKGRSVKTEGIDEKTGLVNVYKLLPEQGDSIMIINCGDHFELRHHHWEKSPLLLTDEDVQKLTQGLIVWN